MNSNVNINMNEQYLLKIFENYSNTIEEYVELRISLKEIE
jgi:hypothetical protein